MELLEVKNLSYKLGNFKLDDINFNVNQGEYFVLLGQSGSGKTLLLESIAGFNKVEGEINFRGSDISQFTPENRDVGFVYQDFALFPNLNVRDNIMFSKKYKQVENPEETLLDISEFLGLMPLLDRRIENLSGGEKQRVAIARALFSKPKILLLDEPLSAIDPTFRNSIMKFLKDIHRRYNLTTIHVTHNFREASYLADRIAIVMKGQIKQVGTASDVLNSPSSIEVAKFLGFKNILPVSILKEDSENLFSVDPNTIQISKEQLYCDYVFKGKLEECMGIIDHYKIFINVEEEQFFAKILKRDYMGCYADRGESIYIGFDKKDICYL
ncbi:ATP-binding cassette domain-containing protein [Sulfurospirillum arcachonense]|uniref:ATP-binding cassette domain-containing protein n=1 Tax=Sulfurospirillum arcachonense TaxID=57666 RepID=UPI0004682AA4|nr:ATP-binding cassette domain-containing protein [Sulfurospirillum arcachonense]